MAELLKRLPSMVEERSTGWLAGMDRAAAESHAAGRSILKNPERSPHCRLPGTFAARRALSCSETCAGVDAVADAGY